MISHVQQSSVKTGIANALGKFSFSLFCFFFLPLVGKNRLCEMLSVPFFLGTNVGWNKCDVIS